MLMTSEATTKYQLKVANRWI